MNQKPKHLNMPIDRAVTLCVFERVLVCTLYNSFSSQLCKCTITAPLAKRFGLTPEHFAENLRDNYQRHEVDQEHVEPTDAAREYLSRYFFLISYIILFWYRKLTLKLQTTSEIV